MPSNKRPFATRIILLFLALHFCALFSANALNAGQADSPAIADKFIPEELLFGVGFWVFDDVAEAKISFAKDPGNGDYVAALNVYTTGFVDRAFMHREDAYISRMRLSGDQARLVPKSFEKTINIRGDIRNSVTYFNYETHLMTWEIRQNNVFKSKGELPMPEGMFYDDPISAFYNFRAGVYGPPARGGVYKIFTFPKKDFVPEIFLRLAGADEMNAGKNKKDGYLSFVKIDKEVFGSTSGEIEIFFGPDMLPEDVLARDILFFGDVRGRLKGKAPDLKRSTGHD